VEGARMAQEGLIGGSKQPPGALPKGFRSGPKLSRHVNEDGFRRL